MYFILLVHRAAAKSLHLVFLILFEANCSKSIRLRMVIGNTCVQSLQPHKWPPEVVW